ncbi:AAA family ATPase [Burkholderia gladioli]|uniref:AAA family ATPase n=1 Tax=Burkholderia gladioli TaxID=28095 RepID=UPI00163F3C18|nr:AAA family ATPase [Burkholderia gladioli]MBU9384292.1 AAA family ATPase [Burkholderia gladioli]MBW5286801.1 AAA family ATPase [Burkholderia gladioli]MDA0574125.1 AAA family ATPase [Burkholderia gladioli]MDA0602306.1 AAA family ATPase [Burkholderia gladioli]MDC6127083.1 AAA family ATPase [Burkholderia gladioli]
MAARIIVVYNQKGGSGKTTTSTNLAGGLGLRGRKTLLVDYDEQGTASIMVANAPDDSPFPASVANLSRNPKDIKRFRDDYEFIIVDCPPAIKSDAPSIALLVADLGIIPVQPSGGNLWAVAEAKKLGMKAQEYNPDLKLRTLANSNRNTSVAKQIFAALAEDEEVPMLRTTIGQRTAYAEAELMGTTVLQIKEAKEAQTEFNALVDEVLEIVGN